jgi:type 2A phosphatase activator TIP41
MFFGCNRVSIRGPVRDETEPFELVFDPVEAVKMVSKSAEDVPIRVSASNAEFWRQRSQSEIVFDYDWTFTPRSYCGTLKNSHESEVEDLMSHEIDYNRLKQQDPILFFDENILYEDELGDNGISIVSVKLVSLVSTDVLNFCFLFSV